MCAQQQAHKLRTHYRIAERLGGRRFGWKKVRVAVHCRPFGAVHLVRKSLAVQPETHEKRRVKLRLDCPDTEMSAGERCTLPCQICVGVRKSVMSCEWTLVG